MEDQLPWELEGYEDVSLQTPPQQTPPDWTPQDEFEHAVESYYTGNQNAFQDDSGGVSSIQSPPSIHAAHSPYNAATSAQQMTPISAPSYPNAEFIPITTFEDNMLLSNVNPPNSYATGDLSQQVALDQAVAAATSDIGTYRADTERFLYQRPTQRSPATVRVGPSSQNGYMHDAGILDYGTNVTAGAREFPGNSLPNSHYRGPHHDPAIYIHDLRVNDLAFPGYTSKWRDTANGALEVRCQLCGNTYGTENHLGTHMMADPPSGHGWSTRYYP